MDGFKKKLSPLPPIDFRTFVVITYRKDKMNRDKVLSE